MTLHATLQYEGQGRTDETSRRKEFLPFALPTIEEDEIAEVVDTLRSGWITTGPKVKRFESAFAEYVGAKHAVAVNSCTAALHIALTAAGVSPGDEVITSPLTFCSTANVVIHLGGKPVFADVGSDLNIDPREIEGRITPRTRALMPVHFSGQPCQMAEILSIARQHDLIVIEDAAHAVGAKYRDQMVGAIGDATAFSFYAIKNMTTGEGGMITTDSDDLEEQMRLLSLHGISRDAWKRYGSEGSWYYEVTCAGYKDNMTDIQAALGIHQLAKLERFLAVRQQHMRMYNEAFAEIPEIRVPVVQDDVRHAWHLYVIQLELEQLTIGRAEFVEALRSWNIGTSVHFIPVHLHPYYREKYGYQRGELPRAESAYDRILSLPLYPGMTDEDVSYVIRAVTETVERSRA